jgi:transitional endoplasmic reticulum ATPase
VFERLGVKPPKGILLYGPPGTGKTMLAKAVANESKANFISVKGPEVLSKWVGESEKGLRQVFEKARQAAPTIIFFDEIDAIAARRGTEVGTKVIEQMVNTFLAELDGLEDLTDVVVIGATNRPDLIDSALLRPGRFDRLISTPIPDKKTRLEIFKIHTKEMPLAKDVKLETLAGLTDHYVGADIQAICREAAILALRKSISAKEVKMSHFKAALNKVKPSATEAELKKFKEAAESLKATRIRVKEKVDYLG